MLKKYAKIFLLSVVNVLRRSFLHLKFTKKSSGYIMILVCVFLPVLLLGIKYTVTQTEDNLLNLAKTTSGKIYKKCAREAALEAARHWNPGLTLSAQKESILKVADDVYNAYPACQDSVVSDAIPGAETKNKNKEIVSLSPFLSVVKYQTLASSVFRYDISVPQTMNQYVILASIMNKMQRLSDRTNDDMFSASVVYDNTAGSEKKLYITCDDLYKDNLSSVLKKIDSKITIEPIKKISASEYKKRENQNDAKVQVSIDNDRIKALTDNEIGYAIPAQCNVDIVLSIPANGAACNKDNNDAASAIASTPTAGTIEVVSDDVKKTPIYQIAQAYRNFLKDNFFYTRGVNVGLIPYSGKVSLTPDKIGYTQAIPAFVSTNYQSNLVSQNKTLRQIFLYSTKGTKDTELTQSSYAWNDYLTGCPIMCRRGTAQTQPTYGNNIIATGNQLLSILSPTLAIPASGDQYYRRMNLNPCYLGYANLLNLKCEKDCTTFLPNPYPIIELTADLSKIYEILGAMYPIYDVNNVSNFVFIPLEWANNLFQSWTNNPEQISKTSTTELYRESKSTTNRKKAIILMVNKPDWFEPGELTYLGFDNDMMDVPMAETDKIDFSQDYTVSTSKKFLDGSNYDGTIQGPKKILKFTPTSVTRNAATGYYECTSGSGRLTFPAKGNLKITVRPKTNLTWLERNSGVTGAYFVKYLNGIFVAGGYPGVLTTSPDGIMWTFRSGANSTHLLGATYGNGMFVVAHYNNGIITSSDGVSWTRKPVSGTWFSAAYGNGLFVIGGISGAISTSPDCANWTPISETTFSDYVFDIIYNGGQFVACGRNGKIATSLDGKTWVARTSNAAVDLNAIAYGQGLYVIVGGGGTIVTSQNGVDWTKRTSGTTAALYGVTYAEGLFLVVDTAGKMYGSSDGITWTPQTSMPVSIVGDLGNKLDYSGALRRFVVVGSSGKIYTADYSSGNSAIKFTNLSGSGISNNTVYTITNETTFVIQPSQTSGTAGNYSINFDMSNIQIVSAEITNLDYDITPINATYQNLDVIDFSKGSTSGVQMSYGTTIGSTAYKAGKGFDCANHKVVNGRITVPQLGTITLVVEKNDATNRGKTLEKICSSGWESGLSYGNGKLLTVNSNGYVAYSTDNGETWVEQGRFGRKSDGTDGTSADGNGLANVCSSGNWGGGLVFADGKWVAVDCKYSYVAYSTDDGKTWVNQGKTGSTGSNGLDNVNSDNWYLCGYYNKEWIAVSKTGYTAYSLDNGKSWSSRGKNGINNNGLENICYDTNWCGATNDGKGKWIALHPLGRVGYSIDNGKTWTRQLANVPLPLILADKWCTNTPPQYANNRWLAISDSGYVAYSTDDGKTWIASGFIATQQNGLDNVDCGTWHGWGYGNSRWVASCTKGYTAYSTDDGKTWKKNPGILNNGVWWVAYGNGIWLLIDSYSNVKYITSSGYDPTDTNSRWTGASLFLRIPPNAPSYSPFPSKGTQYANGRWVIVNPSGYVAYHQTDGKTSWLGSGSAPKISNTYASSWYGAFYGNNKWLSTSYNGYVVYSANNGDSWTSQGKPLASIDTYWKSGASYGNNKWLTVSNNNYVACSVDDGKNWVKQSQGAFPNCTTSHWYNGLGYDGNKWLAVNYYGYVATSTDACVTWINQGKNGKGDQTNGKGLANISSSYWYGKACYVNGMWTAVNSYGYVAYSTDGGVEWTPYPRGVTGVPIYTIKVDSSSLQTINGRTSITINNNQLTNSGSSYYVNLDMSNIRLVSAVFKASKTEIVDDLIDFASSTTSKNSSTRCLTYSGTAGNISTGMYVVSSGTGTLATSRAGQVELTIAPSIGSTSSTFKFGSGSDTVQKTISGIQTLKIPASDLVSGSISFAMTNIALIKAKFTGKFRQTYPIVSDSRLCDWSKNPVSKNSDIELHGTYANYVITEGYHQLRTGSCYPYVYPVSYSGDATVILDAKSPFIPGITMPEYTSNANYILATGPMRLFSPIRRGSAKKYCYLKPYSTTYDNKANLISTDFTVPINTALYNSVHSLDKVKYQDGASISSSAAAARVTSDACERLKSDPNTRIYVVKYRKQAQYKTFPFSDGTASGLASQSNVDHDYRYLDNCASGSKYVYDVMSESDLNTKLSEIAADIKSFANYHEAENVE